MSIYTQVMALYVTGAMNVILTPAHQLEIKRYIYNHQVFLTLFLTFHFSSLHHTKSNRPIFFNIIFVYNQLHEYLY